MHEARMENVGGIFQMKFPIASVFQREARIGDLDFAVGRAIDEIIDNVLHRPELYDQRLGAGI